MVEKVPMTAAGHAALETELKRRTSQERPRIIEAMSEARSHGDLSENAEYHAAKEAQSHNEGRISISSPIARALIGKGVGDTVEVTAPGGSHSYEIISIKFR
jgi:transcription elongation factor GreA